jgi:hypothetical protein
MLHRSIEEAVMRTSTVRALCSLFALVAFPLLAQPEAAELLKNPKHSSMDVKPSLKKLTAEEVRTAIRVTSSRTSALFGFNNAEVQIHLPRVDNSNWIEDDFSDPKLFDAKKREVKYEKEQGIYNHDTWSTEVRFAGLNGKPVDFAHAVGTVRIKYPLVMKTVTVKKSETKKARDTGVTIDGPFVKTDLSKIPESAFASKLEGVRAYDKEGLRLERVMGYSSSSWEDGVSYRGYAFHGEVARVDVDVAQQWATFEIDYDMPPVPKLSERLAGSPSKADPTAVTPGGKYEVKIVPNEGP